MLTTDLDEFQADLQRCADVFSKKLTEPMIRAYWDALKDRSMEDVGKRIWLHIRHGKFFPKPHELRPKLERAPTSGNDDPDGARIEAHQLEHWNDALRTEPLETRWLLLDGYLATTRIRYHETNPQVYADRLDWCRDVARRLVSESTDELIAFSRERLRVIFECFGLAEWRRYAKIAGID